MTRRKIGGGHAHISTVIATYRLNRPRGWFSEKSLKTTLKTKLHIRKCLKKMCSNNSMWDIVNLGKMQKFITCLRCKICNPKCNKFCISNQTNICETTHEWSGKSRNYFKSCKNFTITSKNRAEAEFLNVAIMRQPKMLWSFRHLI